MKKSLLFCLLALTLAANNAGAQNNLKAAYKAPNGVPDFLNVCGDPDLAIVQVSAEGLSAAARKNITATIQLFRGVELIALDPATTTAGVVLVNNSNKNQPVLSLPDVLPGAGGTVFIGLRIAADCGYTDSIGINNDAEVFDSWAFGYKIGSQNFTETDKLAEYRTAFKAPSFTIAVDNAAPPSRVGDCFARKVVCANSALEGFADSVLYTDLLGAGISLKKLYVGGLDIPFTKTKVGNDTLITAIIWGSWIQTAKIGNSPGDGDVFFDPNESLTIREDICMVNCTGSRLSLHSASWGCKNRFCHTVSADGFARIGDGQPNALISNISQNTPKVGYCKSGNNIVRYKNTGQAIDPGFADMVNVSVNIGMGPQNLFNFNGFIADSMTVAGRTISPLTNALNLDNNPLFATDPDGAGGLADVDGDGFFDDLPMDAQFDVQVFFDFDCSGAASTMQDSICLNEYNAAWNTVLGYTDPCKIKQFKNLPNFGSIQNSNEEYVNCADPDTYVNDTFEIMHVETRGVRGFEKSCNGEERFFLYTIAPPGVNPVLSSWKIFKNNSTASLALLSSEQRGDTLYTYWDASSQFVGGKFDIRVLFIPDCNAAPGRLDIPLAFGFECPPCGCTHLWYCEKIHGPQFHRTDPPCTGAPICQKGTATTFFDASRTTFGWADLDYTIPFDPSKANKKVAIPCEIVRMRLLSVVGQKPLTDSLGAIIRYDNVDNLKDTAQIFKFQTGFLQIKKGGTLYQCPIDSTMLQVFKTDSTKTMRFDFAHCMDSLGITLTAGDSVNFYADMSLNPDGPYIKNFRKIPLFRGWTFAVIDSVDYSCDSYGENFFVGKNPTAFAQPGGSDFPKGCSNTPLQYRLLTINNGFKDYFGLEYRQAAKIDSISFDYDAELLNRFQDLAFEVSIPGHPVFGNNFFPVPPFSAADNGHYVARFDTLTRVPSLNLVQNYAFNYRIKLTPTCESEFGSTTFNNQFKLEPKIHFHDRYYAQNIGDGSCVEDRADGIAQKLNYTDRPIFDFEAVTNPNILLGTDTAVWDIKQCNISTKSDALLTWLSTAYDSTELEIVAIQEVTDPNAPIDFAVENYGSGKRFAITPALYRNSATNLPDAICNTIRIKAKVKKCGTSKVALHMGWNCAAFPDSAWTPDLYPPCADDTMSISVTTLDPALDATIVNQPPQFAEFCDTIPLEFLVRNTGQGNTYNNTTQFTIPLTGATLVPGSIQIAWPSNAPFRDVLGLPTFVGLTPRGKTYRFDGFGLLDSTLAKSGLPGFNPLGPDSTNEFVLKIAFLTGCEFKSGTYSFYAINGKKVCDEPTNKETGESLPIYFNGLTLPPDKLFDFDLVAGTFSAGAGSSNLELTVWNKMATPTDTFDKVQVKLPVNVNYQNGSTVGLKPLGWVPGNPKIEQVDSIQILTWTLPVGMVLNDTARLSFSAAGSSIACGEPLEAGISTIRLTDAACQNLQTPCQMGIITGENGEEFIQILVGDESDFASADASICPNGSTQLGLTGSFVQTTWSPEDGLSDPNISNPIASPAVTTTYTINALDANGCLKIDHVTVAVGGQLNIASVKKDPTCGAANGQLTLTVTGGSGSYSYEWSPNVSTTNQTPATLSSGDYLVTVTDGNGGCSATDVFTLMQMATGLSINLTATAASNLNPQGGAVLVNITGNSGPYSVSWSGASDGSEAGVAGPGFNITNLFSGSYDVVVLDKFGCAAAASAIVPLDIINNLSLTATATPDSTCCGGAGTVVVVPTGGNGVFTYQWLPAVSTSTMAAGLAPGIYRITVTDGFGNTAEASAMVADACACDIFPETFYEPAGIEALCLPIPFIYRDEVGLAVNGVPYTGPFGLCDLDTVIYYGFGFVKGTGYDGPYRLDSWSCNNMPLANILFNDIEELADIMNAADPYGYWVIDPDSKAIYGGDLDQIVYGQMKITHLQTMTPYILGVNFTQFAYGTEIYVQPFSGKLVITGYDSLTCCNDMTCIIFLNPCEDLVPTAPYSLFTGSHELCIDVPFAQTDSMKFYLDRDHQLFPASACNGGAGTNLQLSITDGLHELIIFDLHENRLCADTVDVLGFGNLPVPQTFFLQTVQDSGLTQICVDTTEFYGAIQALNFAQPPVNGVAGATTPSFCFDYSPAPGFIGNDSMTVILKDEWGVSDTTYFKISVKSAGVTTDLFYLTTPFQTPIQNICAIVNEIAATGLSLLVCDQPSNGTVSVQGNSCATYTPNAGFWGLDTTCILLCNNVGQCDTTRIFITVLPPGGSSIDTINIATTQNTAVFYCLPITLPGTPASFNFCGNPLNSTADGDLGNPACVTYTPANGFLGSDQFCVEICTAFGACDTTIFLLTVSAIPPPEVTKDTLYFFLNFDEPSGQICPSANEIGGPGFVVSLCGTVFNGSVSFANNCAVFTPTAGFVGNTEFCLQICNDAGLCDTSIVIVTVLPAPPSGITKDTVLITTPFETATGAICPDPSQLTGGNIAIAPCAPAANGAIGFTTNNCVTFTPANGFVGETVLCVQLCDNTGACDTTVIIITVLPVNPPPPSTLDTIFVTVKQDTTISVCVNAVDLTGPITTLTVCGQPANGSLDLTAGPPCVVYDPANSFSGTDQFCLIACDATGICDTTIVIATVTPVVNPPVVTKDTVNLVLVENTVSDEFCLDLSQLGGAITTLNFCAAPANGQLSPSGNNCFVYAPNPDFVGNDAACILFCNGAACDTTIVLITVTPLPGPQTDTVFATITPDSLFNYCLSDSELNTGIDSIAICGGSTVGTVSFVLGTPCFQFAPNPGFIGVETFCMVACDSTGLCDTTVFVITVKPNSTAPPPTVDTLYLSTEINVPVTGCADLGQLPGGIDFIGICNGASNGSISFTPGNPCFEYTPDNNFTGLDSFCVVACNDAGLCDTTLVWVLTQTPTDTSGNFPSSLDTIYVSVVQDSVLTDICFTFDDLPNGSDTLTFCLLPISGSIDIAGDSCVSYSPDAGFTGLDVFCVMACDSLGNCDTTIVIVLVTPISPTGVLDIDTIHVNVLVNTPSPLTCIDLTEIGGSATSFSFCGLPDNGELVQTSGFCVTYAPDSAFVGNDTACVIVCNGVVCDTTILIFHVEKPATPDCGVLPVGPIDIFVNKGDTASLCLNLPLDQGSLYDIFDNGQPYSMGYGGCNFDTMLAYTYFTVPGLGQLGPYNLDEWTVNATVFSGNFPNINALVDSMNVWDPGCGWFLDPTTLTIRGGCFNNVYGNVQITQLATLGVAVIELNQFLNPMGTQISLLPGEHVLVVQGVDCADTLLVNVLLNAELTIDTVVFIGNSDTLCLSNYGFTAIDSVSLNLCPDNNGVNVDFQYIALTNCLIYTGQSIGIDTFCLEVCQNDTCVLVNVQVTSIQPVPCAGFLGVDSLSFNSPNCDTANIVACTNLAFIMAQNYLVLDNNNPVGLTKCPPDANGIQPVGVVLTSVGLHKIVFNNPLNNCKDTLTVNVGCPNPTADLVDTVFVGQTDSMCFSNLGYVSIGNVCENLSGQLVDFTVDTINFCVVYTGIAVGTEPACIVLCDDQGVCDTVNLLVTVIPVDTTSQLPPIAVDDLNNNTTTNATVTIPVLNNDTLNGQLISIKILQQPDQGSAIVVGQNIVYQPEQDYCDSQQSDSLLYEICNAVGCDTAWVSIIVACKDIVIYNGLSPNGDGMNDVFFIDGVQFFPDNELQIFNRWGNEIFKTKGYQNTWKGTFEERLLPDGVYFYLFQDGLGREWSGHLMILR